MRQQSSVPAAFAFTQSDRILQTNVRSSTGISCRLWSRIWFGLNPRWMQRANLSNVPSHLRSTPCQGFFFFFFFWIFIFHKEESVYPSGEGERFLFRLCCFPTEEPSLNGFLTLKELQQQLRCRWNDSHFCSHFFLVLDAPRTETIDLILRQKPLFKWFIVHQRLHIRPPQLQDFSLKRKHGGFSHTHIKCCSWNLPCVTVVKKMTFSPPLFFSSVHPSSPPSFSSSLQRSGGLR